jgi:hypothetical protein
VASCAVAGRSIGIVDNGSAQGDPGILEVPVPESPGGFAESETITASGYDWAEGNGPSHVLADSFPPGNGAERTQTFPQRTQRELFLGSGGSRRSRCWSTGRKGHHR